MSNHSSADLHGGVRVENADENHEVEQQTLSPPTDVLIKTTVTADAMTAKTSLLSEDDGSDVSSASWDRLKPTAPTMVSATNVTSMNTKVGQNGPGKDCPNSNPKKLWKAAYEPDPVIDQYSILGLGFFLFCLSIIWPPLILFFAYIASKIIPYSFRTNDCPANRRKLFADFLKQDDLPKSFQNVPDDVDIQDSYWVNERGMLLHTITMLPAHAPIKAVVFYCHGYTDNVSFEKVMAKQRLVREGIAFCAIEYEGHGLSDGPMGLINDWDVLVNDVTAYLRNVVDRFPGIPLFIMGESMGGAVAFSVQRLVPELIRGVVFVCPMCKISDNMLPPQPIIDFLHWAIGSKEGTSWLGYLPIAPARDHMVTHRDPEKLLLASRVPLCFGRNPRLATARELIAVTQRISNGLRDFDAPFLVVHGLEDSVTDPKLSQALYEESKSNDKSIRLYEGMWHALMCGEPDENAEVVFKDCINWIMERV